MDHPKVIFFKIKKNQLNNFKRFFSLILKEIPEKFYKERVLHTNRPKKK
jgi:hypothetical protein